MYIFISPDVRVRGQVRCCHHCVCLHLYAFLMLIFSSCKAARSMKVKHLFRIFHWMSSTKFMLFDLIVNPRWPPPQKQESPRCQKRILLVFCMWRIFHQIAQINYCLQFHQICWISDCFLIMSGTTGTNFQNLYFD